MRIQFLVLMTALLLFGCEEEPPMVRNPGPPSSPRQVEPAAESSASEPGGDSEKKAGEESKRKNEAAKPSDKKAATPAPKKSAAKDEQTPRGQERDPLAAVPRPKTLSPTNGSALGGSKTTRLVQVIRPTAAVKKKVSVQITSPMPNEVIPRATLKLKVKLGGFEPFKTDSGRGQWVRVVVDNEKARDWYDPDERPFRLSGLAPGWHTVRVFARDESGQIIRDSEAFDAINFYVRTNRDAPKPLDFSKPMLTFNLPEGIYEGAAAKQIPLDFHLANAVLRAGGYRARVKIGALPAFDVTAWTSTVMEGLPQGTHSLSITLLGPDSKPVKHPWNPIERQFTVGK